MASKTAIIGFLGTTLDSGFNNKRWQRWRPSIALCLQEDMLVDELHILYSKRDKRLFDVIAQDATQVSPLTQVIGHKITLNDPWDFADVYAQLYDFCQGFDFAVDTRYLVHLTTGTHVAQICWFLLLEAGFIPAHILQTSPCPKPEQSDPKGRYQVIDLDVSRYDSLRERFEAEQAEHWQTLQANLVTQNADYQKLIEQIEKVATRSTAPILLMGATGAGKSQLAKQIYALKQQKNPAGQKLGQFVEVNCATLRGDTAMSVLFGHVKGAFTGASSARDGLLKSADGGVLFLDEIGELGLDEQAMLLTALEEQRFYPVGSDTPASVSVQLMAGTNKDLRQAVADGEFRADLFARLNTWTFFLPSLKQRLEDLPANIDYELARLGSEHQRRYRFEREARRLYEAFATSSEATWQGNFRDLTASMTRLTTLADARVIHLADVQAEVRRLRTLWQVETTNGQDGADNYAGKGANVRQTNIRQTSEKIVADYLDKQALQSLDPFDVVQLAYVIEVCQRHKSQAQAGRYLFANSRQKLKNPNDSDRLRKYLLKFGLKFEDLG